MSKDEVWWVLGPMLIWPAAFLFIGGLADEFSLDRFVRCVLILVGYIAFLAIGVAIIAVLECVYRIFAL